MMPSGLLDLLVFLLGLCVGSFLNVCIHRFPRDESIVMPPSHCPVCKTLIAWYDNIPLVSYLVLQGKCRKCGTVIPMRYFFIELLTGLAFLGSVRYFGWTAQAASSAILLALLLGSSATDMEERIIPDELSLSGVVLGLLFATTFPVLLHAVDWWHGLFASAIGALAGGGLIYAIGIFGEFVFKKESMGGGDVKLMAMIGAFLGWKSVLLVFFLAPILALPIGLYVKFKMKEEYIPYGPFLSLAGVMVLFFGEPLLRTFFYMTGSN